MKSMPNKLYTYILAPSSHCVRNVVLKNSNFGMWYWSDLTNASEASSWLAGRGPQ